MTTDTLLQSAADLLAPFANTTTTPEPNRLDVMVSRENLLPAFKTLLDAHWGYLSALTGLDHPGTSEQPNIEKQLDRAEGAAIEHERLYQEGYLEALYHFCSEAAVVTLRVRIPYTDPTIPSICGLLPSATLFERELLEMFGIDIQGTPVTDHLLLPDNWPDGVYPLRKEFTGLPGEA
jgi:Ni,Fe-hydrogenase III component G